MNIASLTTSIALCASLLLSSCSLNGMAGYNVSVVGNDGKADVKKTVKVGDFNEIEASQAIKVIFVQGANKGIAEISTTSSAEKYLRVEVKDKTLKAYYVNNDNKNVKIKGPTIIRVSSPVLNEINLSSSANMTIEGNLKVNGNLEVDLSSAASLKAEQISCQKLDADCSSSGNAYIASLNGYLEADAESAGSIHIGMLKGDLDAEASSSAKISIDSIESSKISAESSSAGSISLSSVKASNISAEASSGATINISAAEGGYIDAEASSGASIKLSGKATSLKRNTSSGGSVNSKGLTTGR